MATLVSTVVTAAQQDFNDLTAAKALELFNAAHAKICRHVKLYEDDVVNIPLTSGTRTYTFDKDILRVWSAYLYTASTSYIQLEEFSEDEGDYREQGIRGAGSASPFRWFMQGPLIGFDPTPNITTPSTAITGATTATPIVMTAVGHGMTAAGNGLPLNAVTITGAGGNTPANGTYYAKYVSANSFSLYSDMAQTIPVVGAGVYTSGGVVSSTASYSIVTAYCQKRRTLALTDYIPSMVLYYDAWTSEIAYLWAKHRHRDQRDDLERQARKDLNALSWEIMGRPIRLKPTQVFHVPTIRH